MTVKETATKKRPSEQELYVSVMKQQKADIQRAIKGKRVVKAKEHPFQQDQQGIRRTYVHIDLTENCLNYLHMFAHKIGTRSGRHVHQGGLTIFVVKGKGYSMVDGVRHDWEAGDLVMLPIKKGGVDHQHFNLSKEPSVWLAISPHILHKFVGQKLSQKETSPTWQNAASTEW